MNPMLALRQYQKIGAQAQVSEASPHRLVQMLMEGGLDRIAQAKGAIERGDVPGKGQVLISKAIGIIGGLREGLDLAENRADEVEQLDNLYIYMMKRLAEANIKTDPVLLDEVSDLLLTVKDGWDGIAAPGSAVLRRSPTSGIAANRKHSRSTGQVRPSATGRPLVSWTWLAVPAWKTS